MKNFRNYFKREKWGRRSTSLSFKERGGYFHYFWISVQREKMEGEVADLEGQIRDRFVIE
jgi:hypothetical protein